MTTPIGKALGEGNCARATVGEKEALASQGVLSLKSIWAELAPLRRTA